MKQHTQRFKEVIAELGKQQDVIITYRVNGEEVKLGVEQINSATPRYDADLLKSVMKELHLDSNVDIPVGTEINFKYGLLVDGVFEYLNYGNYIVYTSEKKEDTSSYEILCYDKMLYAMKEYEELNITYPCTVIQYINAIATKMGLKVSSNNNKFPNYNTEIAGEFYLSIDEETKERTSLGYTYRDILDDLAEVTASVICINEYDELEVRDIKDAINYETTEKSKELKVESEIESQIKILELDGKSTQKTRSGKNILDLSDVTTITSNGITLTNNGDGTVTLNGTATSTAYLNFTKRITVSSGEIYSIGIKNANENIDFTFREETSGSNIIAYISSVSGEALNKVCNYNGKAFSFISVRSGATLNNVTIFPMIVKASTLGEYEQYGASPSPEFPSEIHSVGDDVNLFDKGNADIKSFYISPTGISANNTNKYIIIPCKPNTYYSISKINSSIFIVNGTTNYPEINNTDIKNRVVSSSNILESYLTTADTNYLCIRFKDSSDTLTEQEILNSIKVQEGTVATAYSEYGKGTVEIKQTGKNLLDIEDMLNYMGCTYTKEGNTYKITNRGNSSSEPYYLGKLKVGEIYTLSSIVSAINTTNFRIEIMYSTTSPTPNASECTSVGTNYSNSDLSFRVAENRYYCIRVNFSDVFSGYVFNLENVILQEGTEAIAYEQYKGNNYVIPLSQPLRSLPNGVKDTIEEDGIHRRVGSVVYDGSENWATTTEDGNLIFYLNYVLNAIRTNKEVCNRFVIGNSTSTNSNCFWVTGDGKGIRFRKENISTASEFKTWLSTHNTEVIYELAEEVIEPFDEEQQKVIDSMETFEGVNIISSNAELQIRYAIDQDTIDEEYLKDTNVNFGEVFGPVNAVVLSRSSSDNIYRNDVESINKNGLYEIKISDNQILNQNNRDTFIQPIFDKLKGLTYGICDFNSTGIMYYDLLDRFNVKVGDNIYSTVMFHNEQNITQGLEENIYVEKPKTSETDYTKADKTDRKINQTNLIVDKQQQNITALITSNSDLVQKTAQLIIDVDKIEGEISEVADVTTTGDGYGTVELSNINGDSEPIYLRVYPTNEDIVALRPKAGLYPRIGLYPHSKEIYFKNTTSNEQYELVYNIPTDLYQLNGVYDEFILKYETQESYAIHRIGINEDGEKYLLETERIEQFDYPILPLTEGDYKIYIPSANMAYIYIRLMAKNLYTSQFSTKVELNSKIEQTSNSITSSVNQTLTNYDTKEEVNSKISQTATEINLEVNKKVGEDEIISKINQSAEQVQINANKISLARKNSKSNWR